MNRFIKVVAVAVLMMACSRSGAAQDRGLWSAASSTAKSITGDISISDTKLTINLLGFPMAPIRKLEPAETAAVFAAEGNGGKGGNLYRLSIAPGQRFLHKNSLCGSEQTEWMVTNVTGKSMQVAFLSGTNMPVFTPDAMQNSTDLCGTFSYVR